MTTGRVVAFASQKGGSGKTSACVNLAAALGEKGRRVLVVDLDPQASASAWLGVKDGGRGLFDVLSGNGNLLDIVENTTAPGVELVPASSWLVGLEKELAGVSGVDIILSRKLERLPAGRWDFLFLDCPPSLGLLAVSALVAAQEVLVPVEASVLALNGLAQLLHTVEVVRDRLNPGLAVSHILACRVDARTNLSGEVVDRLRDRFGGLVFRAVVRESVRMKEAPSFEKPITLYASTSSGAEDFRAVAAELLKRERKRT